MGCRLEFLTRGASTVSMAAVPATGPAAPTPVPTLDDGTEMDADSDGLIGVSSLVNTVRYDLDGDGILDDGGTAINASVFPVPLLSNSEKQPGEFAPMGCVSIPTGTATGTGSHPPIGSLQQF